MATTANPDAPRPRSSVSRALTRLAKLDDDLQGEAAGEMVLAMRRSEYIPQICLHVTWRAVARALEHDRNFPPHGVGVLLVLNSDGPLIQKDLASRLSVAEPFVSTIVRDLAAAGLVAARRGEEDRRRRYVSITRKGIKVLLRSFPFRAFARLEPDRLRFIREWIYPLQTRSLAATIPDDLVVAGDSVLWLYSHPHATNTELSDALQVNRPRLQRGLDTSQQHKLLTDLPHPPYHRHRYRLASKTFRELEEKIIRRIRIAGSTRDPGPQSTRAIGSQSGDRVTSLPPLVREACLALHAAGGASTLDALRQRLAISERAARTAMDAVPNRWLENRGLAGDDNPRFLTNARLDAALAQVYDPEELGDRLNGLVELRRQLRRRLRNADPAVAEVGPQLLVALCLHEADDPSSLARHLATDIQLVRRVVTIIAQAPRPLLRVGSSGRVILRTPGHRFVLRNFVRLWCGHDHAHGESVDDSAARRARPRQDDNVPVSRVAPRRSTQIAGAGRS